MSFGRLKNPLDGFASYSTHFILLACRTTEQARLFSRDASSAALQAINNTKQLGDAVVLNGNSSDVFLVIDTRRFSQFTIEKLKYEVLINGLESSGSHGNLATEVSMTILDSVGISFINYIQWLMDSKMQCGFDGMIFMLRVLFVGHNQDGTTSAPIETVSIPMHLFQMDVNLDYAKGVYECVFMPNFNFSTGSHKRWLNIGAATNYKTPDGSNTLGSMIDSFEKNLNEESSKFYREISAQLQRAGKPPEAMKVGEFGRMVQYMITIPDDWKKFEYTGSAVNKALERVYSKQNAVDDAKKTSPATSTSLSVDPDLPITTVLEEMFKQVADIAKFANADKLTRDDATIKFYKFLVNITSDNTMFTVHVDVVPFDIPNVVPPVTKEQKQAAARSGILDTSLYQQTKDGLNIPRNFFEFDYIFTGKNLDILNFDMKIQDLQFLLASNVNVGQGELFGIGQGDAAPGSDKKESPKPEILSSRVYDPILMPMVTKEQRKSFSQYVTPRDKEKEKEINADSQAYAKNLSAFYAQSPIMVNMTLRGNPLIMEKFNINTPAAHVSSLTQNQNGTTGTSQTPKQEYRKRLEDEILNMDGVKPGNTAGTFALESPLGDRSYTTTPVFAKINIKGPNVDPLTNELINGQEFAKEVLYNNYYIVFKVINNIEHGVFTQDLELWSHNVYGQGKLSKDAVNEKKPTNI